MEQLDTVRAQIAACAASCGRNPATVCLVVVSKGQSVDAIRKLYDLGVRDFGESRVQELEDKRAKLPSDISWHLIGTLQTKKAGTVAGRVCLIHSVDSVRLAEKLSAQKVHSDILLQVNITGEATKHGFSPEECKREFQRILDLPHIKVMGLMTMAPLMHHESEEEQMQVGEMQVRACFRALRELKELLEKSHDIVLPYLSMGMSQDYLIAIEEGATHLRIGSKLF